MGDCHCRLHSSGSSREVAEAVLLSCLPRRVRSLWHTTWLTPKFGLGLGSGQAWSPFSSAIILVSLTQPSLMSTMNKITSNKKKLEYLAINKQPAQKNRAKKIY